MRIIKEPWRLAVEFRFQQQWSRVRLRSTYPPSVLSFSIVVRQGRNLQNSLGRSGCWGVYHFFFTLFDPRGALPPVANTTASELAMQDGRFTRTTSNSPLSPSGHGAALPVPRFATHHPKAPRLLFDTANRSADRASDSAAISSVNSLALGPSAPKFDLDITAQAPARRGQPLWLVRSSCRQILFLPQGGNQAVSRPRKAA